MRRAVTRRETLLTVGLTLGLAGCAIPFGRPAGVDVVIANADDASHEVAIQIVDPAGEGFDGSRTVPADGETTFENAVPYGDQNRTVRLSVTVDAARSASYEFETRPGLGTRRVEVTVEEAGLRFVAVEGTPAD